MVAVFKGHIKTVRAVVAGIGYIVMDASGVIGEASVFDDGVDEMPLLAQVASVHAKELGINVAAAGAAGSVAFHIGKGDASEELAIAKAAGAVIADLDAVVADVRTDAAVDLAFAAIGARPGPGIALIPAQIPQPPLQIVVLRPPGAKSCQLGGGCRASHKGCWAGAVGIFDGEGGKLSHSAAGAEGGRELDVYRLQTGRFGAGGQVVLARHRIAGIVGGQDGQVTGRIGAVLAHGRVVGDLDGVVVGPPQTGANRVKGIACNLSKNDLVGPVVLDVAGEDEGGTF